MAPRRLFGTLSMAVVRSFCTSPASFFAEGDPTLNTTFVVVSLSIVLLFVMLALAREVRAAQQAPGRLSLSPR